MRSARRRKYRPVTSRSFPLPPRQNSDSSRAPGRPMRGSSAPPTPGGALHFSRLAAVLIITSSMLIAANHSAAQSATAQRTTWEQDYDNGRAAYQKRKHDEAERLWKSALAKKAPPRLVNPKLAVLYTDLGRFWEAMVAYDEYFKAVGNPPPVATQVGSVA